MWVQSSPFVVLKIIRLAKNRIVFNDPKKGKLAQNKKHFLMKLASSKVLLFLWGEQDSNCLANPLKYNELYYLKKQVLDFASELQKLQILLCKFND